MLNSKQFKSRTFLFVMLCALVAQSSLQAFSITDGAVAAKELAQSAGQSIVDAFKQDPLKAYVVTLWASALGLIGIAATIDFLEERALLKRCEERDARIEAERVRILNLDKQEFLKHLTADVVDAQMLFNAVDGSRIIELNSSLSRDIFPYNDNARNQCEANENELAFICAAHQNTTGYYQLHRAEQLLDEAILLLRRRIQKDWDPSTLESILVNVDRFAKQVKTVISLIQDNAQKYHEQEVNNFNQQIADYHANNPVKQVVLHAHTCGNDCLGIWACDCSGCACTAATFAQS